MAFSSMHIGSGPGVSGLYAMHVKPLLPLRKVRILPSAPMATMVACCATLRGAADIALAIICSSLMGALPSGAFLSAAGCAAGGDFVSAADTLRAKAVAAIVILTNRLNISWLRMILPLGFRCSGFCVWLSAKIGRENVCIPVTDVFRMQCYDY